MHQTDPQVKLRVSPELKELLDKAAEAGNRKLSAEIIRRLEWSFAEEKSVGSVGPNIKKVTISKSVIDDLDVRVASLEKLYVELKSDPRLDMLFDTVAALRRKVSG
jgi:hypothetical protein